jgi:hypothetical protein
LALGIVGVVGVVSTIAFRAWLTQAPSRVSVGEAVDRYRSSGGSASAVAVGAPDFGVYIYATTGSESVDALGGDTHEYPSETTITVTPSDCGFRLVWMPLSGRTDLTEICRRDDALAIAQTVNSHEFFHMAQDERFTCDGDSWWLPPADVTEWTSVCRSDGGRTTARVGHVLGSEQVDVGGVVHSATHVRWDDTVTGSSTGTSSTDLWLDPTTGLPLRETSTASTGNDTAVGRVSFEEHIDLVLTSMNSQH